MSTAPRRASDWAELLKREWEARARSPSRDFFIASHPGWDDAKAWAAQARVDAALMTTDLDEAAMRQGHVLEVGCGVGRLAPCFLERFATYTGIDVAPSMIAEARRRLAEDPRARFLECDGLRVPEGARDRRYGLVVALAVLIHCPRDVIASLVADAWRCTEPAGVVRLQLRADPDDGTGLAPAPADVQASQSVAAVARASREVDMSLIDGHYYMGHAFSLREASDLLAELTQVTPTVVRLDPAHIYASIQRT